MSTQLYELAPGKASSYPEVLPTHAELKLGGGEADAESLGLLIEKIRHGGLRGDETVMAAYETAREIGDQLVAEHDKTWSAIGLLYTTQKHARPSSVELADTNSDAGSHNQYTKRLLVSRSSIFKEALLLRRNSGVSFKKPYHTHLLPLLRTTGHEAGHALLSGISHFASRDDSGATHPEFHLLATKSFLIEHPELAMTGNYENDVAIREEQFAEGYGRAVLEKTCRMLGYSPKEIKAIQRTLGRATPIDGTRGSNQLDHLKRVTAKKGLPDLVRDHLEEQGNSTQSPHHRQVYSGTLGYQRPLTLDQIVEQLQETGRVIESKALQSDNIHDPLLNPKVDPEAWFGKVKAAKLAHANYLRGLMLDRFVELHPRTTRSLSYTLYGGTLSLVGTLGALLIHPSWSQDLHNDIFGKPTIDQTLTNTAPNYHAPDPVPALRGGKIVLPVLPRQSYVAPVPPAKNK